ncbi:MAG: hypothetical protein K6T55_04930 [Syntrophobacterales bacterium]|nr:hypothetical protein [Syntrophobacterales bacterium]
MDITRLTLDGTLGLREPEEQQEPSQAAAPRPPSPPPLAEGDRVELVRAQNLASPLPQAVDLKEALRLLAQVARQVEAADRQDLRRLYHDEPLRELCCRLTEA